MSFTSKVCLLLIMKSIRQIFHAWCYLYFGSKYLKKTFQKVWKSWYIKYFLNMVQEVQHFDSNLFFLFFSIQLYRYIPCSLIFKLEDSKDSKDSNCVCHNKYIHNQRKEANRSIFCLRRHLSLSHYVKFQSGNTHFSKTVSAQMCSFI